jgi:hypothetical protein
VDIGEVSGVGVTTFLVRGMTRRDARVSRLDREVVAATTIAF